MRSVPVLMLLAALAGCGATQDQFGSDNRSTLRVADAALSSGSPGVALQVLDGILKSDPGNVDALMRKGAAQAELGSTSGAEATYRRVLAIEPRRVEAQIGLGRSILRSNPAEAERVFAEIVKAQPKNTQALNNLGVARDLQGRHAEAQEAYRAALEASPGLASAQQNLALSLAISGRPSEGAAMLKGLAQSGEGGRKVRDNLALALAVGGNTAEASQLLGEGMSQSDVNKALAAYRDLGSPER